jgi:hypothetical protein
MSLNLNILSLHRIQGQEKPVLPGLLAQNPPRRTARGREHDRLLIYLNLAGNIAYTPEEYAQVTAKLAERFYQTSGSLTFALKTSIETLNTVLAERNMKTTGQGKYSIGVLVIAALRGNALYIVQAGPTRVHWLSQGSTKLFHDVSLAGKGLGLSQTTRMYFAQAQLNPGDLLVMSANQPKEWQAALQSPGQVNLETLHRRLTNITTDSLNAALISVSEGVGENIILRPAQVRKSAAPAPAPPAISPLPQPDPTPEPIPGALSTASIPYREPDFTPEPESAPLPAPASIALSSAAASSQSPPPVESSESFIASSGSFGSSDSPDSSGTSTSSIPSAPPLLTPEHRRQMVHVGRRSARWMAQAIHAARDFWHAAGERIGKFTPRLLPQDENNPESQLSNAWMVFISIAIPILFVTIATTIYTSRGHPALYDVHFEYAREAAAQTQNMTNPAELRLKWQATLYHLDEAEKFRSTEQSRQLRQYAQSSLDSLDRVTRLEFRPAFSAPLSANVRVSRMAASDFDLYLLNSTDGNVLRATLDGARYKLQDFNCRPGTYNGVTVGRLIDIIALPRTSPGGVTLMGMDSSGNLLYCAPGQTPTAAFLTKPSSELQGIDAFAYDSGILYILDARANAIWTYGGQPGTSFSEPFFFFEQDVPRLKESIGLAASGDNLYILHNDGRLTVCIYSRLTTAPTRCTDPAEFKDTRPGYPSGEQLRDGQFRQIFFTQAPNPTVNLLEPTTRSIFRFSPYSLELQTLLRSLPGQDDPLPANMPITAIAFSPSKALFVLADGQVYFTANIP